MTIKMSQISPILSLYHSKIKNLTGDQISLPVAFAFATIVRELSESLDFYQDRRNTIINLFAEKDENGEYIYTDEEKTKIKIKQDKIYSAQQQLKELEDFEKPLESSPLKLEDISNFGDILNVEDLVFLSPIIEK